MKPSPVGRSVKVFFIFHAVPGTLIQSLELRDKWAFNLLKAKTLPFPEPLLWVDFPSLIKVSFCTIEAWKSEIRKAAFTFYKVFENHSKNLILQ